MKILIITQAVDIENPVLGFFTWWIEEFAKYADRTEVICLTEGKHTLPGNVRVHSLGKEKEAKAGVIYHTSLTKRLLYTIRFLRLITKLRHDYDVVFVHMNPEYMILGGLLWRLWGKYLVFWYNHPQDDLRLKLGVLFAHTVLHTSPYAATARFEKARRMPAGIDTALFAPKNIPHTPQSIYIQGRVALSKRVHILLEALRLVRERGVLATVTIVGPEDPAYGKRLRRDFADLVALGAVSFLGSKQNGETPELYASHTVAVNLAAAGHYDKTVLEAMSCETPVIVSSKAFAGLIPNEWIVEENSPTALAEALIKLLHLPEESHQALGVTLRTRVEERESLAALGEKVATVLASRPRPRCLRAFAWCTLGALARIVPHAPRMTVLLYHSISDSSDFFAVSPSTFEKQMRYLREHVAVVPLSRAFAHAAGELVKRDSVAVSFDDGYQDFVTDALPILKQYRIPATVFLLGGEPSRSELGNDHPLLVKNDVPVLADPLISIGSHTQTHKKLTKISPEEALYEMHESRAILKDMFGAEPQYLSYPKGSYNLGVMQGTKAAGYTGAVTVVEHGVRKGDSVYALPRIQIDSSTTDRQFRAKLSLAADWYYKMWKLLH